MNNLICSGFFSNIGNIITYSLIAIVVVICIVLMAKYEGSRKILMYVLGTAIIISGVFSTISVYKEVTSESYVNGSINIENQLYMESFSYHNTSLVLYETKQTEDTTIYSYSIDLPEVVDFNGIENEYQIFVNDYVLLENDINAGSIYSKMYLDFYSTENELMNSSTLNISILFLNNKTALTLYTDNEVSAKFIEQYFNDNGFRIYINEIL